MTDIKSNPDKKINILELRVVRGSGGGPEKTIFLSAEMIDKEKFSTVVVYIGQKGDKAFGVTKKAEGRDVKYIELWERGRFDWRIIRKLLQIIKEYSIDIVHGHDYKSDVIGRVLRIFTPVKLISTVHGWVGNNSKERFYNYVDRKVLKKYDKVIAVNKPIMDLLVQKKVNPRKVELIHNAILVEDYAPQSEVKDLRSELKIPDSAPVLGFVGRISEEKDLPLLFMAVKKSLPDFTDLKVLISGDGPLIDKLKDYCNKIGIGEQVFFLGQVQDIKRVYLTMDVFILTSKTEGIPNVILEAMAMRVPVISTNVGGVGEIIRHNTDGVLIQAGDIAGLCHYFSKMLKENDYRNNVVNEAYKRVSENFGFSARLKRIEEIYKELMRG
jgi:glycosyltransferase involved in cell wall biosynthesis